MLLGDSMGQLVTIVEMMNMTSTVSLRGEWSSAILDWAEQASRSIVALAMPLLRILRSI